jgi:trehalose 6-phosphate phosphatase
VTYLFSDEGRRALRALTSRPILYAFDFDGTLARISSDRDTVTLSQSTYESLSELANRVPCAIVSGRALCDLVSRVDGVVPHLIGNHGLESPHTDPGTLIRAENICQRWIQRLETDFDRPLKDHGAEVENKRFTLTLHYRGSEEPASVRMALLLLLNQLTPAPRLIFGKASVNVLPPGNDGKGPAALALMRHLRQTGLFFIGDDETDEDVFELVEGLVMGVRVGPHEKSRARYFIHHQGEIKDILSFLIQCIDRTPESSAGGESDMIGTEKHADGR